MNKQGLPVSPRKEGPFGSAVASANLVASTMPVEIKAPHGVSEAILNGVDSRDPTLLLGVRQRQIGKMWNM